MNYLYVILIHYSFKNDKFGHKLCEIYILVIIKIVPISILAYIRPLAYVKCFYRPYSVDPASTCQRLLAVHNLFPVREYLGILHVVYSRPRPCNPLRILPDYIVINCGSLHAVTL